MESTEPPLPVHAMAAVKRRADRRAAQEREKHADRRKTGAIGLIGNIRGNLVSDSLAQSGGKVQS